MVQREVGERLAAAPGNARVRRPVGARAARVRGQGAAAGRADGVPPGPERRLGAGRAAAGRAAGGPGRSGGWSTTRSRTAARRWRDRWRWRPERPPAFVSGRGRRSSRSGSPPTSAPSGCRRRSSPSWPEAARLRLTARAPAKVNLCLLLGGLRDDGRHELVTVFESVSLYDELELSVRDGEAAVDEVVCPGVEGPNLVGAALAALRARGGTDRRCGSRCASGSRWPRGWAAARRTPPRRSGLPRR